MSQKEKSCVGKQRNRWLYIAEYDLKKMGVRDLRKIATDTNIWKFIQKETRVLHGT